MPETPYMVRPARIDAVRDETPDVRTLELVIDDNASIDPFHWRAGQFALFSVFGAGECVLTLANSPTRSAGGNGNGRPNGGSSRRVIECTFRAVGKVTNALRAQEAGQIIGIRGPYGNAFNVEAWRGRHVTLIGGGIGMAAVRSPLQYVLEHREDYGDVLVINGARTAADLVYQGESDQWSHQNVEVVRTVDPGGENPEWDGQVGLIPHVFEELALTPQNRVVVACGPPVMLKYLFVSLAKMRFAPEYVVTTLENRMECGIGHCGRCNVGRTCLCTEGPVFTWAELQQMPDDL